MQIPCLRLLSSAVLLEDLGEVLDQVFRHAGSHTLAAIGNSVLIRFVRLEFFIPPVLKYTAYALSNQTFEKAELADAGGRILVSLFPGSIKTF